MSFPDDYRQAMADLVDAHARAVAAIDQAGGTIEAFQHVTELRDEMERLTNADAALRATVATRIRDARSLSLLDLGKEVGVSKQRAAQLIRKGVDA